uniref:Uncharacterized protein n=1 Tax=Arundo donax TaxID=35708 RepID=A0A0A9ARS7_ARUDO
MILEGYTKGISQFTPLESLKSWVISSYIFGC